MVIIIFLLLAAFTGRQHRIDEDMTENAQMKNTVTATLGTPFWFLIGGLLLAVILGYML